MPNYPVGTTVQNENEAAELFKQLTLSDKYASEDEVILDYIKIINKDYATDSFLSTWLSRYKYCEVFLGQRLHQEMDGKSEEVIEEMEALFEHYGSETEMSQEGKLSRLKGSAISQELLTFFAKNCIDWNSIYFESLREYAIELYLKIRPDAHKSTPDSLPQSADRDQLTEPLSNFEESAASSLTDKVKGQGRAVINRYFEASSTNMRNFIHEKTDVIRQLLDKAFFSSKEVVAKISDNIVELTRKAKETPIPTTIKEKIIAVEKQKNFLSAACGIGVIFVAVLFFYMGGESTISEHREDPEKGQAIAAKKQASLEVVAHNLNILSSGQDLFAVSSALFAKNLDSKGEPEGIARSFPLNTSPLYYYFFFNGSIDNSKLKAQLYLNNKLQNTYTQTKLNHSPNKAWFIINETLSPGDWVIKLYSGTELVSVDQFSIFTNEQQKEVNISGVESSTQQSKSLSDTLEIVEKGELPSTAQEKLKQKPRAVSANSKLFIHPVPIESLIRVLNIKPKYTDGIELSPGKYHLKVSAPGYQTVYNWTTLTEGEEKHLSFELQPLAKSKSVKSESTNDSKLNALLFLLESKDANEMRAAAMVLASNYYDNNFALSRAEKILLAHYKSSSNTWTSNDALAYLCKMLGASKQKRFLPTLRGVGKDGNSFKLMLHASLSASDLD